MKKQTTRITSAVATLAFALSVTVPSASLADDHEEDDDDGEQDAHGGADRGGHVPWLGRRFVTHDVCRESLHILLLLDTDAHTVACIG